MGNASRIASVTFRIGELICASIVVGILGRYLYLLDLANVGHSSRIVYSISIASISIFCSVIFMFPAKFTFWCFPVDSALFICWMVAFGLLANLTGTQGCDSYWYWYSWGYYWGRWWYTVPVSAATQTIVGTAACAQWRTTLAFSFIGGWIWVSNAFLGIYVCMKQRGHMRARTDQMDTARDGHSHAKPEVTLTTTAV